MECFIETQAAKIWLAPEGIKAVSQSQPDRISRMPHALDIAKTILNAYENPTKMMEYLPGVKQGVFRITWKPIMAAGDIEVETDLTLMSIRDYMNGRLVMCTLEKEEWFEMLEWAKQTVQLDFAPELSGKSLEIVEALYDLGAGGRSVSLAALLKHIHISSEELWNELKFLFEVGFLLEQTGAMPSFRLTRKGVEAYLEDKAAN